MNVSIKSMQDLAANSKHLPTFAITDINKRITDWIASGGDFEDEYIKQQFRYAENIIRAVKAKEGELYD